MDPEKRPACYNYLHTLTCICTIVESSKSELSAPVKTVIEESLSSLTGGLDPKELNQQFLQNHSDSLDHVIHGEPPHLLRLQYYFFVMQELEYSTDYSPS